MKKTVCSVSLFLTMLVIVISCDKPHIYDGTGYEGLYEYFQSLKNKDTESQDNEADNEEQDQDIDKDD